MEKSGLEEEKMIRLKNEIDNTAIKDKRIIFRLR